MKRTPPSRLFFLVKRFFRAMSCASVLTARSLHSTIHVSHKKRQIRNIFVLSRRIEADPSPSVPSFLILFLFPSFVIFVFSEEFAPEPPGVGPAPETTKDSRRRRFFARQTPSEWLRCFPQIGYDRGRTSQNRGGRLAEAFPKPLERRALALTV